MVVYGLGARLVASPRKEGLSYRMSRFEEALLRLAEASAGEPYFGVGPTTSPPSEAVAREIERAVRDEELVVAACHFAAETIGMKVDAVGVLLNRSVRGAR